MRRNNGGDCNDGCIKFEYAVSKNGSSEFETLWKQQRQQQQSNDSDGSIACNSSTGNIGDGSW